MPLISIAIRHTAPPSMENVFYHINSAETTTTTIGVIKNIV